MNSQVCVGRALSRRSLIVATVSTIVAGSVGVCGVAAAFPLEELGSRGPLLGFEHAHISDYIIGL